SVYITSPWYIVLSPLGTTNCSEFSSPKTMPPSHSQMYRYTHTHLFRLSIERRDQHEEGDSGDRMRERRDQMKRDIVGTE
ncbi:hypothetical protein Bpfe_000934, partial [Biomphalaria pfeifferi]